MDLHHRMLLTVFCCAGALATISGCILAHGESGIASQYSDPQGVACGGRLNVRALTAASTRHPCGTKLHVTNKRNGRSVVVTVNDNGPHVRGRVIDLTPAGAHAIGMDGLAPVIVTVLAGFEDRFSAVFPVLEQAVPSSEVGRRHVTPPKIRKHRYRRHRRR